MADNYIPSTDAGLAYASDDISAVQHPYVKVEFGPDGTATKVSSSDPLPVGGSGAAALGKPIDTAAGATDVGVAALAIRDDVLTVLTPADGDWAPLRIDNLGHVWAKLGSNSGTVIGDVNVLTIPADDRSTDSQSVALATDAIMNDQTALTPKFASISASTSGNNTLVAAVASKKIRVTGVVLVAAGTVTVTFQSGASGTGLSGAIPLAANTGFSSGFDPTGHFETASGVLLNANLSAAVTVAGWLKYVEV